MPSPRSTWLLPPTDDHSIDDAQPARDAIAALREITSNPSAPPGLEHVILCEAQASSYIENVHDDGTVPDTTSNRLRGPFLQALQSSDSRDVLQWHAALMARHPNRDMRPGQYRNIGVTIGEWLLPHPSELFWRMEQFHHWMDQEPDPLKRAIYGHRWFETIHPFADGNGRTGRLLIVQALAAPVAVSRHIWWDRPTYYRFLSQGSWTDWSNWMLRIITDAARLSARDLVQQSQNPTLSQITHMNRQPT